MGGPLESPPYVILCQKRIGACLTRSAMVGPKSFLRHRLAERATYTGLIW